MQCLLVEVACQLVASPQVGPDLSPKTGAQITRTHLRAAWSRRLSASDVIFSTIASFFRQVAGIASAP